MSSFQFKILNIFLLLIIFNFPQVQAQEKNIIIKDNWDQTTDKLAHSTTSFGLYYTLRYFELSKFEAFIFANIIGFSYEVYQINDPRETDSDFKGISLHDMGYNLIGIFSAYLLDQVISISKSNSKTERTKKIKTKY